MVVGFGAAGLTTAITAHDAGALVLVLEKMPEAEAGGNTRVSGNVWFNPTDRDTAVVYLRSLCGDYPVSDAIAEVWADEMSRNTEWVTGLGGEAAHTPRPYGWDHEHPDLPGHECDDGYHHLAPEWGSSRLWLLLRGALENRGVEVLYDTRAQRLIQEGGRPEVLGVVAERGGETVEIRARRGVVLATGGFANDPQLARDLLRIPGSRPWGSPGSTGDGLRMALKAGAGVSHLANFMARPGLKAPEYRAAFAVSFPHSHGWINVTPDGRRFIREDAQPRHGKVNVDGALRLFPERTYFGVFDEATRAAGPIVPRRDREPFSWNTIVEGYEWSDDNLAEIERGWIVRGDTPGELAERLGVDPDGLEAEIEAYNDACRARRDPHLRRAPETLVPLEQPPFYGYRWGPMLVYTCGGPRKDEQARVLDPFGDPIPRLYCAGEVSATYTWGMSGGQMIGEAMAFGRIAGRNVSGEPPAM